MSYRSSWEPGLNGERRVIFAPSTPRPGRRVVALMGGYGGPGAGAETFLDPARRHVGALAARLASAGFLCIAPDLAYGRFGADPAPARLHDEWQAAAATYGCDDERLLAVVISAGFTAAHHFARTYPGELAAVYAIQPGLDLVDIYTNDRAGVRTAVGSAWGVTYPAALPGIASPADNPSVLANTPGVLAYSTADNVILPATVTAYAAATGMTLNVVSNELEHGDPLTGAVDPGAVVRFLAAHGG